MSRPPVVASFNPGFKPLYEVSHHKRKAMNQTVHAKRGHLCVLRKSRFQNFDTSVDGCPIDSYVFGYPFLHTLLTSGQFFQGSCQFVNNNYYLFILK